MSCINIVDKARIICITAHRAVGQKRKYTGVDYHYHPIDVCDILKDIGASDETLAAALLHDIIEDTHLTYRDILLFCGKTVADLVLEVTDISKPEDGNRATRKEIDRQHLAKASPDAKTIKLADLIDNSKDIARFDPDFAKVYMNEKRLLLEVLTEGDMTLYQEATRIVDEYFEGLKENQNEC